MSGYSTTVESMCCTVELLIRVTKVLQHCRSHLSLPFEDWCPNVSSPLLAGGEHREYVRRAPPWHFSTEWQLTTGTKRGRAVIDLALVLQSWVSKSQQLSHHVRTRAVGTSHV